VLVVFYGLVYGTSGLLPHGSHRVLASMFSILVLGGVMLLAVTLLIRRDVSWRGSLALGREPIRSVVGWSLLGFATTYAVNILLVMGYVLSRGSLETQAMGRVHWLQHLAEIPSQAILPLAAFVGLWEETVFRGFLLGRLRAALPAAEAASARLLRDAAAVVLCGLCFGAGHGYQGPLGLMQTTAAGIVLGAVTVWRGSLWPAIGAHLAIDTFGLLVIKVVAHALSGGTGGGFGL
jgi:membrane protease YdiL (CAAX protease family)